MEGMDSDGNRLPTFKCPRDLSLAGKVSPLLRSRKNFVPNIPPKRDRGDRSNSTSPAPSTSKTPHPPKSGSRGRGRDGQGRERKKPDLVQASSIFSDGVGDGEKGSRRGGRGSRYGGRGDEGGGGGRGRGGSGGGPGGPDMVPFGPNANMEKFLRARDEEAGDNLKRDLTFNELHAKVHEKIGDGRFLADLDNDDENVDTSLHGVHLPMSNYLTAALEEMKTKSIQIPIKPEEFNPALKKDEDEPQPATATLSNGLDPLSFAHALITAPPDGTLVFFQMPDQLPVLDHTPTAESGGEVKEAKLSSSIGVLPEGYIGKMQIFASGASRLLLGENTFDIRPAKPVSFRQELVAIDLTEKKMTALGPVKQKFLCTPDLEQLFRQAL